MTAITHPDDALALLRREFITATMLPAVDSGGRLYGYQFKVGNNKHFAPVERGGGVDYQALRLFLDGAVYSRRKRAERQAEAMRKRGIRA